MVMYSPVLQTIVMFLSVAQSVPYRNLQYQCDLNKEQLFSEND